MNKSAEAQAEEMYPEYKQNDNIFLQYPSPNYYQINLMQKSHQSAFLAGYHSRDSEIEKLVEVLREIIEWPDLGDEWFEGWNDGDDFIDGAEMQQTAELRSLISKAKEALKTYQK